jgi:hypothetical protein
LLFSEEERARIEAEEMKAAERLAAMEAERRMREAHSTTVIVLPPIPPMNLS